jgi:hypothetical protein
MSDVQAQFAEAILYEFNKRLPLPNGTLKNRIYERVFLLMFPSREHVATRPHRNPAKRVAPWH